MPRPAVFCFLVFFLVFFFFLLFPQLLICPEEMNVALIVMLFHWLDG